MKKKIHKDKKKETISTNIASLRVFAVFIIFIFVIKKLNLGNNLPITGSAVLDTGQLNSGYVFGILILISVYAIITCSCLSYRSRKLESEG